MKKVLLLTLALLFCAGMAFGQAGGIGLYLDSLATSCSFDDDAMGLVPVYVIHTLCVGGFSTASQFKMQASTAPAWGCSQVGVTINAPTSIGNLFTGISIGYGGCVPCPFILATVNYFCSGAGAPECAYLEIVGDPASDSGEIEVVDCAYTVPPWQGVGSRLYANPTGACPVCGLPTRQLTSWGKIKTLYGE